MDLIKIKLQILLNFELVWSYSVTYLDRGEAKKKLSLHNTMLRITGNIYLVTFLSFGEFSIYYIKRYMQ